MHEDIARGITRKSFSRTAGVIHIWNNREEILEEPGIFYSKITGKILIGFLQ